MGLRGIIGVELRLQKQHGQAWHKVLRVYVEMAQEGSQVLNGMVISVPRKLALLITLL